MIRSILLSAAFMAALSFVLAPLQAAAADKMDHRTSTLTYEGKVLPSKDPKALIEQLAAGLRLHSTAETMRLHFVAVKDGQALKMHSSDTVALRKRPGRMKMIPKDALPSAEFFDGLAVKDFITPKTEIIFTEEKDLGKMAEVAFENLGQTEGLFIVTTFDDMIKGEASRGLVGFGSWN